MLVISSLMANGSTEKSRIRTCFVLAVFEQLVATFEENSCSDNLVK